MGSTTNIGANRHNYVLYLAILLSDICLIEFDMHELQLKINTI